MCGRAAAKVQRKVLKSSFVARHPAISQIRKSGIRHGAKFKREWE